MTWKIFWISCSVISVKPIQHNMRYLGWSCHGKNEHDQSGFVGTILINLSKAYDCLPHDLMVAKREAYGLAKESLQLINNYQSYRKQRAKIGSVL